MDKRRWDQCGPADKLERLREEAIEIRQVILMLADRDKVPSGVWNTLGVMPERLSNEPRKEGCVN